MEQTGRRILATDSEEPTRRCCCEILNTDKAALSSRPGVLVGKHPPALQYKLRQTPHSTPLTPFKSE